MSAWRIERLQHDLLTDDVQVILIEQQAGRNNTASVTFRLAVPDKKDEKQEAAIRQRAKELLRSAADAL